MQIKKINFNDRPLLTVALTSILLNFIIEAFSRHSVIEALSYLATTPLIFFYNSFIIFFTFLLMFWFKRKMFMYSAISIMWIGFGVTNGFLLSKRVTPFTAIDLSMISTGIAIMPTYMSKFQIALIFIGVAAVIGLIILLWFKAPISKNKINYKKNFIITGITTVCLFGFTNLGIQTNVLADFFPNIAFAYKDYGFPYCFSNTLLNTGISKPDDYSEETMDNLAAKYNLNDYASSEALNTTEPNNEATTSTVPNNENTSSTEVKATNSAEKPNVIMIQLESFFDITAIKDLSFSKDPIPNFRKLSEEYSHGYLTVPTVGAGTANTEFEVLTGMSLDFFGAGEYPFKTVLKDTPTESIAYNLKKLGYPTHAIHNNTGTFYDRNLIFSNLGFDSYSSKEFMTIEKTPTGWAKDDVLIPEIFKALNASETSDFVYTISVQSHGEYPTEPILENPEITVEGAESEEKKNAFTYYVNQIYQVDKVIGRLVEELKARDEKTVLVLFGDHLPTLGFQDEDINGSTTFQTKYVIWDNFNLKNEAKDLEAYQLTSTVLNKIGIDSGILTKFNNEAKSYTDYMDDLELIQYDLLYGRNYITDGVNPFIKTDLIMGLNKMAITSVTSADGQVTVKGENFTPISYVYINGKKQETIYLDPNTLVVKDENLDNEDKVSVHLIANDHTLYNVSEDYIYTEVTEVN